jgi:hypothetical protein
LLFNQKSKIKMTSIIWRDAEPADLPRILQLWDEQEKRFAGTRVRVDRPQLFWEQSKAGDRQQASGNRKNANALAQFHSCSSPTGNHKELKNPDVETLHGNVSERPAGWRYKPPIMRLRVAEKEGQIVGFRYVEAVPEVCLVTGDEDVMKTLGRELTEECYLFKSLGFRSGWGLVPEKFANALARFTRYSPVRLWKGLRLIGCDFSELGD